MEEVSTVDARSLQGSEPSPETEKKGKGKICAPEVKDKAMKILRAASGRESYYDFGDGGDKPSRIEVYAWYFYEFCSYLVQTVVIPVLFPLIISQLQHPTDPVQEWNKNHPGLFCREKEVMLYSRLTTHTISVSGSNFSSFQWTAIAWAGGLALAAPILSSISFALDGSSQTLVTVAATGVGVFFCLPAGFFKITKIFIPYVAGIGATSTIASASHTHHLGIMVRGFTGRTLTKAQFHIQQRVSGWLSLHATAAGCVGSALISSFTYHMLRHKNNDDDPDGFVSLWVVSIFSGLIWLAGVIHAFTAINRNSDSVAFSSRFHPFSIFRYPHGFGAIFGVFISSFTTMCIFTAGVIFIVGQLCIRPVHLLYFWLTYFLFPLISMPLLNPIHHLIKASAVKMQILGFLLSILSSGFGFYYHENRWKLRHLLIFGAIQSTSTGILHAFGRALVMNCAPAGKEGAFSIWFAWTRSVGLCAGFAVGASVTGRIRTTFGTAFVMAIAGIVVLLFGNVSEFGGANAAGHIREESDRRDPSGLRPKETLHV